MPQQNFAAVFGKVLRQMVTHTNIWQQFSEKRCKLFPSLGNPQQNFTVVFGIV